MEGNFDKYVVIPDIHGYDELLSQVIDRYIDDDDICFISLGDIVDSRLSHTGVRRCFELFHELDDRAVVTKGNHEWALLGAMVCEDESLRPTWIDWWGGYENNTLRSYGVLPTKDETAADKLTDAMKQADHYDLFRQAPLYVETGEFIVVHAGLSRSYSWETQRAMLDEIHHASLLGLMVPDEMPTQISSFVYAEDERASNATNKTLITGHDHQQKTPEKSVTADGKRVRLATPVHVFSSPLFVWESWSGNVETFHRDAESMYHAMRTG